MGKTRDLFEKIKDTKRTHARMGRITDRNSEHLTEAEGIKKMERRGGQRFKSEGTCVFLWLLLVEVWQKSITTL